MHNCMPGCRFSGVRLHKHVCIHLVSHFDKALVYSAGRSYTSSLDYALHPDGPVFVSGVARRLGTPWGKGCHLCLCSSICSQYTVVRSIFRLEVPPGRIGGNSSALDYDSFDDDQILAGFEMGLRANDTLHFLGKLCRLFELQHYAPQFMSEMAPLLALSSALFI